MSDIYEELNAMQKTWIYMEKIFAQSEIKIMLAEETKTFSGVNKWWESGVASLKKELNKIITTKRGYKMLRELRDNNEKLEHINQSLQQLLEDKRNKFPRFYFLSDDEVIDIIATDKLDKLQGMLNKIFDGITRLKLDE